jgi:GNAT superfamily N-acetyltransferase
MPREDGLRCYTPGDWEAAKELTHQLFDFHRSIQGAPSLTSHDGREILVGWLARRDSVLWVWQEAGEVLGLARARRDGVYFLEEFVIAEGCRGQGIGARFLAALEDQLRAEGARDVFLSMVWPGNPRAVDFYLNHGYDLLNSFELRKGLDRDRRGREIELLGQRFYLGDTVPEDQY